LATLVSYLFVYTPLKRRSWCARRSEPFPAPYGLMYREDYARAGIQMPPVIEPDCRSTARQMILYTALLLVSSMLPLMLDLAGSLYGSLPCCSDCGFSDSRFVPLQG
jgi:heme O synthase-like polyprenyltransferase